MLEKLESYLDPFYEKLTEFLGSTPVQLAALLAYLIYNVLFGWTFINVISQIAVSTTLLILRGQSVQNSRSEKAMHTTKKDTKEDLKKSDEVIKKLDKLE